MKKTFKEIVGFIIGIPFAIIAFTSMIMGIACMFATKASDVAVAYLGSLLGNSTKEERDETIEELKASSYEVYEAWNDIIFDD